MSERNHGMAAEPPRYPGFAALKGLAAFLALLLIGGAGLAQSDPDLTDVDDVLGGRRVLVEVDDLLAVDPKPGNSQETTSVPARVLLNTENGAISGAVYTSDGLRNCAASDPCNNPFPQQERILRMFDLPNDVKLSITPTTAASGTDCQGNGTPNLMLRVDDIAGNRNTFITVGRSGAWVQMGTGDFNFDGYDDALVLDSAEAYVVSARETFDFFSGLEVFPSTALPTAVYRALTQPATGDVNGDGILDVVYVGGNKNGPHYVYVVSVCPGDVPNTVCDGAIEFRVIFDPLSFAPVELTATACGGPGAAVGNYLPGGADEVLAVFGNSSCAAQARLLELDGEMRPTQVGQIQVGANTASMFATTTRFDWFGETDQAVTLSAGLAVVGQNPIQYQTELHLSVITFNDLGQMTAHQYKKNYNGVPLARGLATGVFGPPPGGFVDPSDFTPQIAVLLMNSEESPADTVTIFDVDPENGFTPVQSSVFTLNGYDLTNECGPNYGGSYLQSGDLYGRSVRVGNPEVIRISQSSQPQIILGVPPMHVDYVQLERTSSDPPETVNFTTLPSGFHSSFETQVTNSEQSSNSSTTSYSTAVKTTDEISGKVAFGKTASVSETNKQVVEQTHDQSVEMTYNTYTEAKFDASTETGFSDQLWLTTQTFNVYAYPVIGQTGCPADDPDCEEESPLYILFSAPDDLYRQSVAGISVEWYHPVHQPGQVFSYPWSLDQLRQRAGLLDLLTEEASFFTDDSFRTVAVEWSGRQGTDATSGTVSTYSQETEKSVSGSAKAETTIGGSVSESEKVDQSASSSFETLNSETTELGSSAGVGIQKPDSFREPGEYQYRVAPYLFGQPPPEGVEQSLELSTDVQATGVLETAFVADPTDPLAGPWWRSSPYAEYPDVALNHPQRWKADAARLSTTEDLPASCLQNSSSSTEATCYSIEEPDPDDVWLSRYYWMRGLLVTVGGASGPQQFIAEEGENVFLQARVYNYSLTTMPLGSKVRARFYRQQWSTSNLPIGDSVLISEQAIDPIPPFNSATDTTAPNWQVITTSFNTNGLGNTYWVFWVVVWIEDAAGDLVAEVPGHGLSSRPGELREIGDAPIEMVTVEDFDGNEREVSFSNNVGFLNKAFHVTPATPQAVAASEAVTAGATGDGAVMLEMVRVTPDVVRRGDDVEIGAVVFSPTVHSDEVQVHFYDGLPGDGGRLFDVESLSRVRAGDRFEARVPYRAEECGTHTVALLVNPNIDGGTMATTSFEVECDDPPVVDTDEDDGCAVAEPRSPAVGTMLLLLAALAAAMRRARTRR